MKVGILTLYYENDNYGGLLQAYALQKVLGQQCEQCEQICIDVTAEPSKIVKNTIWYRIRKFPWRCLATVKRLNPIKHRVDRHMRERKKSFRRFEKKIPHSEQIYNGENYKNLADKYDVIVVGSDQVWSNWLSDEIFKIYVAEGGFGKTRLVAYAASISSKEIVESHKRMLKNNLGQFSFISVREETAKKQLKEFISNKKVQIVCDPVLLLPEAEWAEFSINPLVVGDYVFCYFLGQAKWHRKFAQRFAKRNRMPIVYLPYIQSGKPNLQELSWGDIRNYDAEPAEFLGFIRNAKVVITDSFHAMVFSVIFRKKFYVLLRCNVQSKDSMNARIVDFLKQLHLEGCLVEKGNQQTICEEPDFRNIAQELEKQRGDSLKYIRKMLD